MSAKKILIAEDEPVLLKALNIELLDAGYEVLSATTGTAAVEVIERERPDLVLLDVLMPELDGFGVLEKINTKEELKKIPVIILSNLDQGEEVKKGLALGARDYFVKASTELKAVIAKVKELIG
jgi:DNA-binding response OmpR family regulator